MKAYVSNLEIGNYIAAPTVWVPDGYTYQSALARQSTLNTLGCPTDRARKVTTNALLLEREYAFVSSLLPVFGTFNGAEAYQSVLETYIQEGRQAATRHMKDLIDQKNGHYTDQ